MKNTIKKITMLDAMIEARENDKFNFYSKNASLRIRLAVEIFNAREAKGLSQQELAKRIFSTQKVISKIENGDVNIGIEMLSRLSEELNFTTDNFVRVFSHLESSNAVKMSSAAEIAYKVADWLKGENHNCIPSFLNVRTV